MSIVIAVKRRAVSLVEVIFSMGVILIGLLGVMSILPLAGNRAQDSVSLSVGATMANSVASEIVSQRWLSKGNLIARNLGAGTLDPFDGSEPFCIDPAFVAGNTFSTTTNGYEVRLFPYYKLNHDPTVDPATAHSASPWPVAQPRMRRVGIRREQTAGSMEQSEALHISDSRDDLLTTRPKARTDNVFRPGYAAVSGGLPYGSRFATGEFSWIATVNPMSGGRYGSVSVVIIRNRQRGFSVPLDGETVDTPEKNTTDERVAYVSFASGFQGGSGGIVHLVSSANTVHRIRSGDWIMLSNSRNSVINHRWYRVVSADGLVDGRPETLTGTPSDLSAQIGALLPGSASRQIWRRKLYLDGPDWDFGYTGGFAGSTSLADLQDNTFATLVENVVSVTEHTINASEL